MVFPKAMTVTSTKTILVIEDSETLRQIIITFLEETGHQVISAANGDIGLRLSQSCLPDVILCDIVMPQIDGYEVLRQLRQHPATAATPFIFLSAKADRPDIRRGMILGADDYLTKPFTQQELIETVQAQLSKKMAWQAASHPIVKTDSVTYDQQHEQLQQALVNGEFELYYQPKISLKTGSVVGAEALLRWRSPTRGFISPGEFIPIAEKTGFIIPLGTWVIRTVCAQIKDWETSGLGPMQIAINLSSAQFAQTNLCNTISDFLKQADVSPAYLEVELTESLLVQDIEATIERMQALQSISVSIAIDDFGTGYASLGYLQHFPFNVLKIDRCFVANIDRNTRNAAIVNAVIQMAHDLNLNVVAEGIETQAEWRFLQEHGCDSFQGYLISKPLPKQAFVDLLKQPSFLLA